MKLKVRNSKSKYAKKTGFLTRQKTKSGKRINARQRRRSGSI
jgi:ribosomal protein L34